MKGRTLILVATASVTILANCSMVSAQQNDSAVGQATDSAAASSAPVPRLINFTGVVKDASGRPANRPVSLTLSLYELQEDGSPLWSEILPCRLLAIQLTFLHCAADDAPKSSLGR